MLAQLEPVVHVPGEKGFGFVKGLLLLPTPRGSVLTEDEYAHDRASILDELANFPYVSLWVHAIFLSEKYPVLPDTWLHFGTGRRASRQWRIGFSLVGGLLLVDSCFYTNPAPRKTGIVPWLKRGIRAIVLKPVHYG